jgi:ATP-dependent Lhr-like helicase
MQTGSNKPPAGHGFPETEQELHTLLMIEGDLIAGEIDVPVEWLDRLARAGGQPMSNRDCGLPRAWPGIRAALDGEDGTRADTSSARVAIPRRDDAGAGAGRYLWPVETAQTFYRY